MSPDLSRGHERNVDASVAPGDSASHTGAESPPHSVVTPGETHLEDVPFPFKFKAPSGRVHRLQVIATNGLAELIEAVISKLGSEIEAVGGVATFENGKLGLGAASPLQPKAGVCCPKPSIGGSTTVTAPSAASSAAT